MATRTDDDFSTALGHLIALYGVNDGLTTFNRIRERISKYNLTPKPDAATYLSHRDAILITYGDQVRNEGELPLQTLERFCRRWLDPAINWVHILPFFPYSSDDGFSVIDYRQVDPALGGWREIAQLEEHFRLMFDAVINHISSKSAWFRGFLHGEDPFKDYFIVMEGKPDLSSVFRPRALPLLTRFDTPSGKKSVWTTFSEDQIDLNYRNPEVLIEMMDLLFFYISHGAELIRLDAIAYLWKEPGTRCIHLAQTHHIVQFFRAIFDLYAPYVKLITETNVPHSENISYFGDGSNEAQLVYNFALPPLVLHTLQTGDARAISQWAASLSISSEETTFFNFLASHDGIGLTPASTLIKPEEVGDLISRTLALGGLVSYRNNPDGTKTPYELNINYFDALRSLDVEEDLDTQVNRFIAAHAIMLALIGVPGIYFHSLFGSNGWLEGVTLSGHNRSINREKLALKTLEAELSDRKSRRWNIYNKLKKLLLIRAAEPAFDPYGEQLVLDYGRNVFAIQRSSNKSEKFVVCLTNVTARTVRVRMNARESSFPSAASLVDLISGESLRLTGAKELILGPYQTRWITTN
jgi:sucrose phosphorylase